MAHQKLVALGHATILIEQFFTKPKKLAIIKKT